MLKHTLDFIQGVSKLMLQSSGYRFLGQKEHLFLFVYWMSICMWQQYAIVRFERLHVDKHALAHVVRANKITSFCS